MYDTIHFNDIDIQNKHESDTNTCDYYTILISQRRML